MKKDTTEKGLEAHITQHLCLLNDFEVRHFRNCNRLDCVEKVFINSCMEQKHRITHIKIDNIDTAIAIVERKIEYIREYKEAMIAEAVM
jgi:hypothetical protein